MTLPAARAAGFIALAILGGIASAAGPAPGNGPWVLCPNNSSVCAAQLGADLDSSNEIFDCLTNNGSPGRALQSANTGRAHCWAL